MHLLIKFYQCITSASVDHIIFGRKTSDKKLSDDSLAHFGRSVVLSNILRG